MLPNEVLEGSPIEHYAKIIQAASPDVIKENMMEYFRNLACLEAVIEKHGLDDEVKELMYSQNEDIDNRVMDFVIESMTKIVMGHDQ